MIPGSANPLLLATAAAGGYAIERSLRFNSSDSGFLSRTPSSAGNRKTWTFSCWVKRSVLGSYQGLISSGTGSGRNEIIFNNDDKLRVFTDNTSTSDILTAAVFRDPSAFYHIVVVFDSTQATAANRIRIYINGVEQDKTGTYPSQNLDGNINNTLSHNIARTQFSTNEYFSGYLADIHFIDGQALDPTSFGEFSATTGVWNPKAYTGSYGTNGFHLDFADNSSNTATTLGKDTSGNGNNWTPNNLSVTAGAGNDSLVDVPTNGAQTDTGVGGEVRGNYCTWNPLALGAEATLSNGNLDIAYSASGSEGTTVATHGVSTGKWYWEVTFTATSTTNPRGIIGITRTSTNVASFPGATADSYSYYPGGGVKYNNNTSGAYGAVAVVNDVIGVALNLDAGEITFYNNGVSQGVAYSSLPAGTYFPAIGDGSGANTFTAACNWGQRPFAYTAPSGFKALNTANLPAPVVTKPSDLFDVKLWTGNGAARSITGLGFSPDLVWIKARSTSSYRNALFDIVRGANNRLISDLTNAEDTGAGLGVVSAFNSDGFSLDGGGGSVNETSQTYVGWAWDAGTTTTTNTVGSITSSVRANATAGFSIVTWTGAGSSGTIGHGLGVEPHWIIVKNRTGSADNWSVYTKTSGAGNQIYLNLTDAVGSGSVFPSAPTSTVMTIGGGYVGSSIQSVAYCFAPVAGYSSFGVVTGTGTSDGGFAYTGFRPRFLLYKNASAAGNWGIYDSERDPENVCDNLLLPSSSSAEITSVEFDLLSNGIKLRYPYTNGHQIVFAAFAEHPFQYARAR